MAPTSSAITTRCPSWASGVSELNPSGTRDYDGTADAHALEVQILASGDRQYAIWVYCWAYVESQTGFAVATRSSAMIRCHMPYLFVEEVPI